MERLLWDESLETGIVELDIQHRNLFNILKILNDAIENNNSSEIIKYILIEIDRYTFYHITFEEELLKKYNVLSEEHQNQHNKFKEISLQFKESYNTVYDKILAQELSDYIYNWINSHIMKIDMEDIKSLKKLFISKK